MSRIGNYEKQIKYPRVLFHFRWSMRYPPDNWCIIGITEKWLDPTKNMFSICFFGLELRIILKHK